MSLTSTPRRALGAALLAVLTACATAPEPRVEPALRFETPDAEASASFMKGRLLELDGRLGEAAGAYAEAVESYMRLASEPKESVLFDGAAHGTQLFEGASAAQFRETLLEFLKR